MVRVNAIYEKNISEIYKPVSVHFAVVSSIRDFKIHYDGLLLYGYYGYFGREGLG